MKGAAQRHLYATQLAVEEEEVQCKCSAPVCSIRGMPCTTFGIIRPALEFPCCGAFSLGSPTIRISVTTRW